VQPNYIERDIGSSVVFVCHRPFFDSVPRWLFNNALLKVPIPFSHKSQSLLVSPIKLDDSGVYSCIYKQKKQRYISNVVLKVYGE